MTELKSFLANKKYKKIKFKILKTQHLLIKAKVNAVPGLFILDTGASNSCLGFEAVEKFDLQTQHSSTFAASASSNDMFTKASTGNTIQLSTWKAKDFSFVLFDLSSVNTALSNFGVKEVDGIIGADVLLQGKAIIDYPNQYLYLQ